MRRVLGVIALVSFIVGIGVGLPVFMLLAQGIGMIAIIMD